MHSSSSTKSSARNRFRLPVEALDWHLVAHLVVTFWAHHPHTRRRRRRRRVPSDWGLSKAPLPNEAALVVVAVEAACEVEVEDRALMF